MSAAVTTHAEQHGHGEVTGAGFDADRKTRWGMLFYVITDIIFVSFMFISYIWLRGYNTDQGWFPYPNMKVPDPTVSAILVALVAVSGLLFYFGALSINAGHKNLLRFFVFVAWVLVIVALVWQVKFMGEQQFASIDGSFASIWTLINGYHAFHLFLGCLLGLGVTIRAFKGKYSQERHLGITTIGYFWYWMAIMPVVFYTIQLLLPANIS